jgi:hypothetical protein
MAATTALDADAEQQLTEDHRRRDKVALDMRPILAEEMTPHSGKPVTPHVLPGFRLTRVSPFYMTFSQGLHTVKAAAAHLA